MANEQKYDVIIIGAGAAGMMCAIEAGRRGRSVLVIDHGRAPGEKIRISGGGRCNFTHLNSTPKNFLSANPHFAKSALSNYGPGDFLAKVQKHGIAWHEKTAGQLFCDGSATQIVSMLTTEMAEAGCRLFLNNPIMNIEPVVDEGFRVISEKGIWLCTSLVIATGGKSIPKMGASGFGYELARRFGHEISTLRAGLVPFTWPSDMIETWRELSGVSLPVRAACGEAMFNEAMLLTHRGLSGPAMLQISSYWKDGQTLHIDLLPDGSIFDVLTAARAATPKAFIHTALADALPRRLAEQLVGSPSREAENATRRLADLSNADLRDVANAIHDFQIIPGGTEGYRTAEVTLGGIETDKLNQKTMESRLMPGLYFIGEVVDVTGHLGGHNFQWAWASGFAAGQTC